MAGGLANDGPINQDKSIDSLGKVAGACAAIYNEKLFCNRTTAAHLELWHVTRDCQDPKRDLG